MHPIVHVRIPSIARRKRARKALIGAVALFALGAGGPAAAQAGTDSFCNQSVGAGVSCLGPNHSLTGVRGTNNTANQGCGGAYGGAYACGAPSGCRTFSGDTVLTPMVFHNSVTAKSMSGYSTWGVTGSPCGSGRPAADGLGQAEVKFPAPSGLPVFKRQVTAMPAAVAALFPGATEARRIDTPRGAAWVAADDAARQLCVAADDRGTGFGVACAPYGAAVETGVSVTLFDNQLDGTGLLVGVVAHDGDSAAIYRGTQVSRKVVADRGVAVAEIKAGETTEAR